MTVKTTFFALLLAAMMCVPFTTSAQVTIGSGDAPHEFSVLELISNQQGGGLRLPQIANDVERDVLFTNNPDFYNNPYAEGLMIFNMAEGCVEFWNGDVWISLCVSDRIQAQN